MRAQPRDLAGDALGDGGLRLFLLLALGALAMAALVTAGKARGGPVVPAAASAIASGPLTEDGFWALVDHSAALEADPEAQLADLRRGLERLTPEQIAQFEQQFDQQMRRTYTWDLWGAAYVANGGASDDGFEYFRCWLISKGRRVVDAVVARPDDLADLLESGERGGDLEFEDFAYIARETWAKKTGRDASAMPHVAAMAYNREPTGEPFREDQTALAARYPKLWKRIHR